MTITRLQIPYDDFELHEVIDPDQFDLNNKFIVDKINEIRAVVNQITDSVEAGQSGADIISLTPIEGFASDKLQSFLKEVIARLRSTESGKSGADFIASTKINGVEGNTVQSQLASLKALLDNAEFKLQALVNKNQSDIGALKTRATNVEQRATTLESDVRKKADKIETYSKREIDRMTLGAYVVGDYTYHTSIDTPANAVELGVDEFVEDLDKLQLYVGGVFQTLGVDYEVITIDDEYYVSNKKGTWDSGTRFDMVVTKNTRVLQPIDEVDGSVVLRDGTVTPEKFHPSVYTNLGTHFDTDFQSKTASWQKFKLTDDFGRAHGYYDGDLNELTAGGVHAYTGVARNKPDGYIGIVEVIKRSTSVHMYQFATSNAGRSYNRYSGDEGATWGPWQEFGEYARKDSTKEMVVEVRTDDPDSPAVGRMWLRSDL